MTDVSSVSLADVISKTAITVIQWSAQQLVEGRLVKHLHSISLFIAMPNLSQYVHSPPLFLTVFCFLLI